MKGYMFTSQMEMEFQPSETVTNIYVPEHCVFSYTRFGRLGEYEDSDENLERARQVVDGEVGIDGRVIGEVDIPESDLLEIMALGVQRVLFRDEESKNYHAKVAVESKMNAPLKNLKDKLDKK